MSGFEREGDGVTCHSTLTTALLSLTIIATNSASGFMGYVGQVQVDWKLVISFTIAATLGILLGSYLSKFINAKYLQKGFGYFVLIVGVFVLVQR
ncbi:MAG: sulfite exporter TauE/SafE family protein [Phormidesmis sp.]